MPRYLPERPLPPYAFLPGGAHPHPIRDPHGHAHGRAPAPPETAFVWGVDLYNHGFYWEAHEVWEGRWRAEGSGAQAAFLQGLIQCAAACLKLRGGKWAAAQRLASRAMGHLEQASEGGAASLGLDLVGFAARFHEWMASAPESPEHRPRLRLSR